MERTRRFFGVILASIALFVAAWVVDLFEIRGMGPISILFTLGSAVLGFFMIEFEEELKMKRQWIVEVSYIFAILLAYFVIEFVVPQAITAAKLFVLFLAVPIVAIHARKLVRI